MLVFVQRIWLFEQMTRKRFYPKPWHCLLPFRTRINCEKMARNLNPLVQCLSECIYFFTAVWLVNYHHSQADECHPTDTIHTVVSQPLEDLHSILTSQARMRHSANGDKWGNAKSHTTTPTRMGCHTYCMPTRVLAARGAKYIQSVRKAFRDGGTRCEFAVPVGWHHATRAHLSNFVCNEKQTDMSEHALGPCELPCRNMTGLETAQKRSRGTNVASIRT